MNTTCWHCNSAYPIDAPTCPECGAANGNVDLDKAIEEMNRVANCDHLVKEAA